MDKVWTYLKLKNGDKVQFAPPPPDGDRLGGITQEQREQIAAGANNKVSIDTYEYTISDYDPISGCRTIDNKPVTNGYSSDGFEFMLLDCNDGDVFRVTSKCVANAVLAVFYSDYQTCIGSFSDDLPNMTIYRNQIVKVPDGCRYVAFNNYREFTSMRVEKRTTVASTDVNINDFVKQLNDEMQNKIGNSSIVKKVKVDYTDLEIDADGAVNLLPATASKYGVVKVHPQANWKPQNNFGVYADSEGLLRTSPADAAMIDAKTDGRHLVAPNMFDYAVRSSLVSNSQITDADKPAICETIGAATKEETAQLKDDYAQLENAIFTRGGVNLYNQRSERMALAINETSFTQGASLIGFYVPVDPNVEKTVTVKRDKVGNRFRIVKTASVPSVGVRFASADRLYVDSDSNKATITLNDDTRYVYVAYYSTSQDTLTEEQLLEGMLIYYGTEWIGEKTSRIEKLTNRVDEMEEKTSFPLKAEECKSADVYAYIDSVAATHSNYVQKTFLCNESTGLPIYYYTMGNGAKKVCLVVGQHGPTSDPRDGVITVAKMMHDLISCNFASGSYLEYLHDNCTLLIFPVLNPWGFDNNSRNNAHGVNINRDWASPTEIEVVSADPVIREFNAGVMLDVHTNGTTQAEIPDLEEQYNFGDTDNPLFRSAARTKFMQYYNYDIWGRDQGSSSEPEKTFGYYCRETLGKIGGLLELKWWDNTTGELHTEQVEHSNYAFVLNAIKWLIAKDDGATYTFENVPKQNAY